MTYYLFPETGTIPGVPGTFAGVRVDIDDQGNVTQTPLSTHLAFLPSVQEEAAVEPPPRQEEQAAVPEETPIQHLETLEQEGEAAITEVEHPEQNEPTPPTA